MEGLLQAGSSYFYYKLAKARLGWKLVRVISHYPSVLSVLLNVLILIIMACISFF
ncbi:hypothetical protein ERO13_D05G136050v2 [Gossypium hirsutum]|nr:hypothetical protein ERO13_D05G136050v2 [Gossypium hirsutum]